MKPTSKFFLLFSLLLVGLAGCVVAGGGYYDGGGYYGGRPWYHDGPWAEGNRAFIGVDVHPFRRR